jgi:ligand-binding SRPBCC domain-containing protein
MDLVFESRLRSSAEQVWKHATSMTGVNEELRPILQMTHPAGMESIDGRAVPLGTPLFRSSVRLFGVLPVDVSDLTLVEIGPGYRFLERSPMKTQRVWQHERTVNPDGEGCILIDRLSFEPRLASSAVGWVVRKLFEHRQRRLRAIFG